MLSFRFRMKTRHRITHAQWRHFVIQNRCLIWNRILSVVLCSKVLLTTGFPPWPFSHGDQEGSMHGSYDLPALATTQTRNQTHQHKQTPNTNEQTNYAYEQVQDVHHGRTTCPSGLVPQAPYGPVHRAPYGQLRAPYGQLRAPYGLVRRAHKGRHPAAHQGRSVISAHQGR